MWSSYLSGTEVSDAGRGWCIEEKIYRGMSLRRFTKSRRTDTSILAAPLQPCMPYSDKITFVPTQSTPTFENTKCLAAHPMLNKPTVPCPCSDRNQICIKPSSAERITRIRVKKRQENGNVILWTGDRRGALYSVLVGTVDPRFLGGLVRWTAMFIE